MKKTYAYCSIFLAIILVSCSATYRIKKSAKTNLLHNQAFISAHTGISIYEPATGKYWFNYQGDKYFVPASNTKLFTCYAAMKYLGDSIVSFRYKETGDTLFIIPDGDPTLLGSDFKVNRGFDFLKSTNKTIVIYTSLWNDERWGNGWAWNDYNDDYAAERSVMPVYENMATFSQGKNGLDVAPSYFSKNIVYQNAITNNKDFSDIQRDISSNTFFVGGNVSLTRPVQVPFYTANDSVLAGVLEDTLQKQVYVVSGDNESTMATWHELHSQPTDSLLNITMHRSDNFFAEQSLLMVSAKLLNEMNDAKIIDTLLKTDYSDLPQKPHWVDGSGLSHYNLFSPQDFVTLLNKMKISFGMDRIKGILATGGSGTITSYYKDAAGYIFAKTGTLSGVVALSGFLYTKKNKLLIFSVLVNNHHTSATSIRQAVEKFIESIRNQN